MGRCLLCCALALLLSACAGSSGQAGAPGDAAVVRVVDGDTVVVRLGGTEETVRLIGIDTPETVKPAAPVECYGPEASAHLKTLLPPGTAVHLARDTEARDHFGRLLVYLRRAGDDLFVNLDLAQRGLARPLDISPNSARAAQISAAASQARAAGLGLWGACEPTARPP